MNVVSLQRPIRNSKSLALGPRESSSDDDESCLVAQVSIPAVDAQGNVHRLMPGDPRPGAVGDARLASFGLTPGTFAPTSPGTKVQFNLLGSPTLHLD
jgi:hypothetical protein